jgi:hypothetical protein
MIAFILAIDIALILGAWTYERRPNEDDLGSEPDKRDKLREFMVQDIRANTQSCGAYLLLVGAAATFFATRRPDFVTLLNTTCFKPFIVAFSLATIATLFIPAGYGKEHFKILQRVWLRSILCGQIVVISTFYGIFKIYSTVTGNGTFFFQ